MKQTNLEKVRSLTISDWRLLKKYVQVTAFGTASNGSCNLIQGLQTHTTALILAQEICWPNLVNKGFLEYMVDKLAKESYDKVIARERKKVEDHQVQQWLERYSTLPKRVARYLAREFMAKKKSLDPIDIRKLKGVGIKKFVYFADEEREVFVPNGYLYQETIKIDNEKTLMLIFKKKS